jgi:hypothetical protein
MKRKLGGSLIAALMMMGMFGVASATAEPGPNGTNDKGLCTAFFNGQKTGHDKDGDGLTDSARPFQVLEAVAGAAAEMLPEEVASLVYEFCMTLAGRDGGGVEIGGNPNDNGRFECTQGAGEDGELGTDDDTYTCEPNDAPGNGGGPQG